MHTFILVLRGEYIFDENGIGLGFGDCDGDISYSPIACRLVLCFLLTLLGVAPFVLLFARLPLPPVLLADDVLTLLPLRLCGRGRPAALSLIKSYLFLQFSRFVSMYNALIFFSFAARRRLFSSRIFNAFL